jgi:alpha-L-fucosidase
MNDATSKNKNEWAELHQAKQASLERFQDARFGMFIHWGLYSQLAGVYQGKRMEEGRSPRVAEWIMHAFSIPRKDYQELASSFTPTAFDADAWVALAKSAGMRYMVLTSKHHDGFALFDSTVSLFTSVAAAPCKRDFVKELHEACERQGLAFGLYYSHSIDWMDGGDGGKTDYGRNKEDRFHAFNDWDPGPNTFDQYIEQKSLPQVREILTRYSGLSQIWFDVPYHIPDHHSFAFYKTVSNLSPQTLVCERVGNGYGDYGIPGDNVIPEDAYTAGPAWETPSAP